LEHYDGRLSGFGAASSLDSTLNNNTSNASVNFPVSEGTSFNLFGGNHTSSAGYFATGVTFTLTANFSDGSTSSAATTITTGQ